MVQSTTGDRGMSGDIQYWNELTAEYNIPESWHDGHEAVQEAQDMEINVDEELDRRINGDLRDLTTFTVDPDGAKDYDDALSIEDTGDGYKTYVHIADVSHYIKPGSELDQAAEQRGVTFYLGDNTRHMLPEELSTELCSLVPNEERLACTVEMDMTYDGIVEGYDTYKSVIESDERLSYTEADNYLEEWEWFRDDRDDAVGDALEVLNDLTATIKEDRWDSSLIINKKDSPSGRIIEEMMIKANECIGDYAERQNLPILYRIEDSPENGWQQDIKEDLAELGYSKTNGWLEQNTFEQLNEFMLDEVEDGDIDEARKAIVTKLPRARYAATSENHFALNTQPYTHFTSPIRRAADLKTHQMIFGDIKDKPDLRHRMSGKAARISERQKEADEAERAWDPF